MKIRIFSGNSNSEIHNDYKKWLNKQKEIGFIVDIKEIKTYELISTDGAAKAFEWVVTFNLKVSPYEHYERY